MKPSLSAGVAVGLATGAWMFGEYALGLHDDPAGVGRWTGFLALVFPVLGAFWLARHASWRAWTLALRGGLIFGVVGGLVGGAAVHVYFTYVNPGFGIGGHAADPWAQATAAFVGSSILGPILTVTLYALAGRKGGANG